MKTTGRINAGSNQLWWTVTLLAIAVVLPTICLLWFMTQAVRNERLAVKQKLTNAYEQRLENLSSGMDDLWSARISAVKQRAESGLEPIEVFAHLAGQNPIGGPNVCDAIVIYDKTGRAIYPVAARAANRDEFPDEFNRAWSAEFTEQDFDRAIGLYEQIAESHYDDYVRYSALMGKVRCLRKSSQMQRALALCREIAYGPTPENISSSSLSLVTRARILLVELKASTQNGLGLGDIEELIDSAVNYTAGSGHGFLLMPSETRIFLLRKAIELARESEWSEDLKSRVSRARMLLRREELASAFLDKYGTSEVSQRWSQDDAIRLLELLRLTVDKIEGIDWDVAEPLKGQLSTLLDSYKIEEAEDDKGAGPIGRPALATLLELWPEDNVRRLELPEAVFGIYHSVGDRAYLLLQKEEGLGADFESCQGRVDSLGIAYRVTDGSGAYVWGLESPEGSAFLKAPLGKFFPGWTVEIHFKDANIFETTAARQRMIYVWAGLLAIAVMLSAGLLAARIVGKQMKTNKLKNDFIATVSHELKTPLASMRVLVDTLLEGSYRDQRQVTEYLELVSKENERLTGLIDNFLSFSRMERNKQAFTIVPTSASRIARDAAEAVKTKFSAGRCAFEVDIGEDLPGVLADRDAMITVLVNLLDNAYKYSYDDKRIELRAFARDGSVCFTVCDNGAGISRRSAKKIFKRFYQVDRRLSRNAEGCGLGLSIAKFIVDAHKGSIGVESRPGEGSIFTVELPAVKQASKKRTRK